MNANINNKKNVSASLIENNLALNEIRDSIIDAPQLWVLETTHDPAVNGVVVHKGSVVVPLGKRKFTGNGDIVASVGDYVVTMSDGRRFIVYTDERKAAIEAGDLSWVS